MSTTEPPPIPTTPPALFDLPTGPRVIVYDAPATPEPDGPLVPRRPAAILPVLVCLPRPAAELPDAAAIRADLSQVLTHATCPAGTVYRTRSQYAALLAQRPGAGAGVDSLVVRAPDHTGPACLGGALASLAPPPAQTRTGVSISVIAESGVWLGFLPGRDSPGTAGLGPPPITHLHGRPDSTVIIAIEATVPLRAREPGSQP